MNITGIAHIEFTVTDLQRSVDFYSKLPGFKIIRDYPHFKMFECGGIQIGITDHSDGQTENRFNEFNVGLDHLSFSVSSREDLDEVLDFFDKENIPHGEINDLGDGNFDIAFRDPDNIQLEFSFSPIPEGDSQ